LLPIAIGITGYFEKENKNYKNIGTHGTFATVSCHILVERDFHLKYTKDGDEID
jgi:hypothetical protein